MLATAVATLTGNLRLASRSTRVGLKDFKSWRAVAGRGTSFTWPVLPLKYSSRANFIGRIQSD
jgi:hypothetical protein